MLLRQAASRFFSSATVHQNVRHNGQNGVFGRVLPSFELNAERQELDSNHSFEPRQSTLSNGIRLITQDNQRGLSCAGLFFEGGSNFEGPHNIGSSQVLEQLAFRSNDAHSTLATIRHFESIGTNLFTSRQRDSMQYSISLMRDTLHVPKALELFYHATMHPSLHDWDVAAMQKRLKDAMEESSKDVSQFVSDYMHATAFRDSPLANPLLTPKDFLNLPREVLVEYLNGVLQPERMVLAATNIDHDFFVEAVEKTFGKFQAQGPAAPKMPSQYVGGDCRVADMNQPMAYVSLCFEGPSASSEDLVTYIVLNTMMGGGDSFSAGGPGKGMHSRMYRNVLNKYGWVSSASFFCQFYENTGICGFVGYTDGANCSKLADVFCAEATNLVNELDESELQRAKNLLQSSMWQNLESSSSFLLEDLGRNLLQFGRYVDPLQLQQQINAVTMQDVNRVVKKLLSSPLTVVAHGDIQDLPRYDVLSQRFK